MERALEDAEILLLDLGGTPAEVEVAIGADSKSKSR
jgi:hypothetical protein